VGRIRVGTKSCSVPSIEIEILYGADAFKDGILVGIRSLGEIQGIDSLAAGDVELAKRGLPENVVSSPAKNRLDACTDRIHPEIHGSISRQRQDLDAL
jgi:hypothetical protein